MAVETTIQVAGGKQAINSLRKIDPQLQKTFKQNVNEIAGPAIRAGANAYQSLPLSHMGYRWRQGGRNLFPFDVSKARAGVRAKIDTRKRATAFILIEQANPGAAIFETAGRKTQNRLGQSLDFVAVERGFKQAQPGRTRLLGPAVYRARRGIEGGMERLVIQVVNDVQRELG